MIHVIYDIGNIDNEWFMTRWIYILIYHVILLYKYPTLFIIHDNIRGTRITLLQLEKSLSIDLTIGSKFHEIFKSQLIIIIAHRERRDARRVGRVWCELLTTSRE